MNKIDNQISQIIKQENLVRVRDSNFTSIKVSVFVLCYNHEKYLQRFFESVLDQKVNFGVEIVINDDCSTDGSRKIIGEFSKRYPNIIVPIYQKENCYKNNRSKIFKDLYNRCKGQYLALCESDDYYCDEHKLLIQSTLMDENPDIYFSSHYVNKIDSQSDKKIGSIPEKKIHSGIFEDRYVFDLFRSYQHPQTSSYFIRKDRYGVFVKECGNLSRIVSFDDMSAMLLSTYGGEFLFVNRYMTNYSYLVDGGWISKKQQETAEKAILSNENYIIYCNRINELTNKKFDSELTDLANKKKINVLFLKEDLKSIFSDKTMTKYLKKKSYKSYVVLSLKYKHPKLYKLLKGKRNEK